MTNSYQDYCLLGEIHNFEEKSPNFSKCMTQTTDLHLLLWILLWELMLYIPLTRQRMVIRSLLSQDNVLRVGASSGNKTMGQGGNWLTRILVTHD